jgi:preprotein translocase subunit SecA
VHYVVSEDRVMIVDEYTGRMCPDRTWREGLHQAVEAFAGVTITEEHGSEATISRPAYFQLYERMCGLTGTAAEAAPELQSSYELSTVIVPQHRPCQRAVLPDRVFATRAAKYAAIAEEVRKRHATGQPILIGTRTIENSEALVDQLAPLGLTMRVLNAKQDAEEAAIIEQAGQPGAITIATNMAGRGAHIPVPEKSREAGGLHVIGLERHESARVDRQLIGRGARQGQPGSAQFFLSLEDDLLTRHSAKAAERIACRACSKGELPGRYARYFLRAQRHIETLDRAQRRALVAHHQWVDELKKAL